MSADDAAYEALFVKIERERGFRGAVYRQKCLRRRIAVRMRARGVSDVESYLALLDHDPFEYDRLLRTLTINVSKFFRNPETWSVIRATVLPDLLRRETLMAWSAGAAAGEEAYSLAILIWEWLAERGRSWWAGIRVVGTDIDAPSLQAARRAEYSEAALADIPAEIRDRWFEPGRVRRLKEPLRSRVEFRLVDVLASAPGLEADLIICRNLLIYLDRPAQTRVFETFAEVLRPRGYLVLGRVEMLSRAVRPQFEIVDLRERVYRKL